MNGKRVKRGTRKKSPEPKNINPKWITEFLASILGIKYDIKDRATWLSVDKMALSNIFYIQT